MPFPGRPFRAIMSRAFHRYRTTKASQDINDDKLDSRATAEWPTTEAEPTNTPSVNPTIEAEPTNIPSVDPIIESVFEKKDGATDLSEKYKEASSASPFKQISADQIDEKEDGEPEPVLMGSEPTPTTEEESPSEPDVSPLTDQPAADISEPVIPVPEEPVLEQPVAEAPEAESIISPTAEEPVAAEPAAPAAPEPPPISVDSLISNSMGNIFQKKATKDPILKALLDRHSDEDMQELADDLREFAEDIGASDKSE
ncbi:MAG: hypothetical protein H8E48_13670 [Chloroflexi bacterium]|nr:hypothetical protein [Chloroflexota bacterium]